MREFDAWNFAYNMWELAKYMWIGLRHDDKAEIHNDLLPEIEFLVEQLEQQTRHLQLKATHKRASRELKFALIAYGKPTWGKLADELRILWEVMGPEMKERRFASIEVAKGALLDEILGDPPSVPAKERRGPSKIWLQIWKRFPSAKEDCEETVYCYALERNTACVFHSMRVAEIGLRALARRMKVKLPRNKRLEWGQWQELLKEMRDKTDCIFRTAKPDPQKMNCLSSTMVLSGSSTGSKMNSEIK